MRPCCLRSNNFYNKDHGSFAKEYSRQVVVNVFPGAFVAELLATKAPRHKGKTRIYFKESICTHLIRGLKKNGFYDESQELVTCPDPLLIRSLGEDIWSQNIGLLWQQLEYGDLNVIEKPNATT